MKILTDVNPDIPAFPQPVRDFPPELRESRVWRTNIAQAIFIVKKMMQMQAVSVLKKRE